MRYLLFILVFSGCMLPKETRKANRAKQKAFKLIEKYDLKQAQLVRFTDTLYIDSIHVDTFAVFNKLVERDTVELTKDRVKIQLIRDSITDTVYVSVQCPADTVYIENEVEITTPIIKEAEVIAWKAWKTIRRWWWLLFVIIITIFTLKFLPKFRG